MSNRSVGFALTSLEAADAHDDVSSLNSEQRGVLDQWHEKLSAKYPKIGTLSNFPVHLLTGRSSESRTCDSPGTECTGTAESENTEGNTPLPEALNDEKES